MNEPIHRVVYAGCPFSGRRTAARAVVAAASELGTSADGRTRKFWWGEGPARIAVEMRVPHAPDEYFVYPARRSRRLESSVIDFEFLRRCDAIVFVVDTQVARANENERAFAILQEDLVAVGRTIENTPVVFQLNKRDLRPSPASPLEYPTLTSPTAEHIATCALYPRESVQAFDQLVAMWSQSRA